jgi:hypothetical protein
MSVETAPVPSLYLLNAPVVTDYGEWRFEGPLSLEQARALAAGGFVSAIGHEGSARLLSTLLGQEVPTARIVASLAPGDRALVLRLKGRLPEGKVLSEEEVRQVGYELGLLTRVK